MNTKPTDLSWSLGTLLDFAKLALHRITHREKFRKLWLCQPCAIKISMGGDYAVSAGFAVAATKRCACCGRGGPHASVARYRVPGYLTVRRIV